MDMFGTPKPPQQSGQLSWKSLGQEKPNHKYKRRERGKGGEWVYYYEDEKGKEFKADAKGKPLPKHHDWQEGDTVIHDSKKYKLGEFGDNVAMIEDANGKKAVRIAELTHEAEHQKNLVKQHETKWDRLVSALERDLEQGEEKKEYEFADSKLELQRKIKYAKEERDKRKGNQGSQEPTPKSDTQGSGEATIPEFKTHNEAIDYARENPDKIPDMEKKRDQYNAEAKKLMQSGKMQEAMKIAGMASSINNGILYANKKHPLEEKSSKDQTETPEFKKWFGNSKVVDKNGKPLIVYHGTPSTFTKFDNKKNGEGNIMDDDEQKEWPGFYFSSDKETARAYGEHAGGAKNIMPVYLSIKNLAIGNVVFPMTAREALKKGYDGMVRNEREGGKEYVVFKPEQIKSAEKNKGTFDPESADITKSIKSFFKQLTKARKETDTNPTEAQKELSSTQIDIPKEDERLFIDFANSIPEDELYIPKEEDKPEGFNAYNGYGRETEPHVTVLYGLTRHRPRQVTRLVKDFGEVSMEFAKTSLFESKEYDVLKVEVKSETLKKLNKLLTDNVKYENDHPDYKPHLTIAYLKKGEGKKYVGDDKFKDIKIISSQLVFSNPKREHIIIEMSGNHKVKAEGDSK